MRFGEAEAEDERMRRRRILKIEMRIEGRVLTSHRKEDVWIRPTDSLSFGTSQDGFLDSSAHVSFS